MQVAYYYLPARRLPPDHPDSNPYGALLVQALERQGLEIEFADDFSESYLRQNRGRIDVLHLNWPHYLYWRDDAMAMLAQAREFVRCMHVARELGYKLVWTAHNLYPHDQRRQRIDHQCRLEVCRLATAVITHCDAAAREVTRLFGRSQNIFVIPHGNFIGVYSIHLTHEQARQELHIPMDHFVYGFFGRVQPYKGLEELIDCFLKLPREDVWLLLSGGSRSDYLDLVRSRAVGHERVVLRAYQRAPSEEIPLIMQASDVIVLPFRKVTTSGSLMLALSCSKPVIVPALGCLPSTVDPAAGILYAPDASDGLYEAMTRVRGFDMKMAARAALTCASRFDWDEIGILTVRAYSA